MSFMIFGFFLQGMEFRNSCFHCNWTCLSLNARKTLLFIGLRSRKDIVISSYDLLHLSLKNFLKFYIILDLLEKPHYLSILLIFFVMIRIEFFSH